MSFALLRSATRVGPYQNLVPLYDGLPKFGGCFTSFFEIWRSKKNRCHKYLNLLPDVGTKDRTVHPPVKCREMCTAVAAGSGQWYSFETYRYQETARDVTRAIRRLGRSLQNVKRHLWYSLHKHQTPRSSNASIPPKMNQAHLIHDHSTGRSSTRLHAPPGGASSMGTSFGWDDAPAPAAGARGGQQQQQRENNPVNPAPMPERAPRARKGEFVDNRIGAGVVGGSAAARAPQQQQQQQEPSRGFGDSGASCVKVHHAPGGKSSGNILSWD